MPQQQLQHRLMGRVRYQQRFARRIMQHQPVVERVIPAYHMRSSGHLDPVAPVWSIPESSVAHHPQLQEQMVSLFLPHKDHQPERFVRVETQHPDTFQMADRSADTASPIGVFSVSREDENLPVVPGNSIPLSVAQESVLQYDTARLYPRSSNQKHHSDGALSANKLKDNNKSFDSVMLETTEENKKSISVQRPVQRPQSEDQEQQSALFVCDRRDDVWQPAWADARSVSERSASESNREVEPQLDVSQSKITQPVEVQNKVAQKEAIQARDQHPEEEQRLTVAGSTVQQPAEVQREVVRKEVIQEQGQHLEEEQRLPVSESTVEQLPEIQKEIIRKEIDQEKNQSQIDKKPELIVSQFPEGPRTISTHEILQTEDQSQEQSERSMSPEASFPQEDAGVRESILLEEQQKYINEVQATDARISEAYSGDNVLQEPARTRGRQARRRSRIEEYPQSSQPLPISDQPAEHPASSADQQRIAETQPEQSSSSTSTFSPQEWLARLIRHEQAVEERKQKEKEQQATASTEPSPVDLTRSTPISLSEHAHQVLQPLVGIDPASVEIHQGPVTDPVSNSYHADAVTLGEKIILASDHREDTPETLGLLAHELTHVARQRIPRFVPPIIRPAEETVSNRARPFPSLHKPAPSVTGVSAQPPARFVSADEEAVASQVEASVTGVARTLADQSESNIPTASASDPFSPADKAMWSNLPAPWEPLPSWLLATSSARESHPIVTAPTVPTQNGSPEMPGSSSSILSPVQRAGQERNLDLSETRHGATDPAGDPTSQVPEPDLDDLARQVYMRIKRRLGVETRRDR